MKTELRALLKANAGLFAEVGNRIEWDMRPHGQTLPALALHLISGPRDYTMRGRVGLTPFRVQMDVWAANRTDREDARNALVAALDNFPSGDLKALFIDNEGSDGEPADGPDSTGSSNLFRARLDVIVWALED
jgi:hypothetical protein